MVHIQAGIKYYTKTKNLLSESWLTFLLLFQILLLREEEKSEVHVLITQALSIKKEKINMYV